MPGRDKSKGDGEVDKLLADLDAELARDHPDVAHKPRARLNRAALAKRPLQYFLGTAPAKTGVAVPERIMLEHAHLLGASGGGKTNALQLLIEQAIGNGRGVMVIDPHGGHKDSLYRRLLAFVDTHAPNRTVHIIDAEATDFVTGFNPLARLTPDTEPSVIADILLEAVERVWGQDMHDKPTIQSVITASFMALAELGLTLADAPLLYDPDDATGFRANVLSRLENVYARRELERIHELAADKRSRDKLDIETRGVINRLGDLVRNTAVATMLSQTAHCLDLRRAMDDGDIILVNLHEGDRTSGKAARVLGTILLRYVFAAATRRTRVDKPFLVCVDECHNVLSGDLARLLPEARKFGVGVVLSHQYLFQLKAAGIDIYEAVRSTAHLKMVFRLRNPDEAEDVARDVFRFDYELPKPSMIRATAVGQEQVILRNISKSSGQTFTTTEAGSQALMHGHSEGSFQGSATAISDAAAQLLTPDIGWFTEPEILRQTLSSGSSQSDSTGSSLTATVAASKSSSRARSEASTSNEGHGASEAYRTFYEDLPTTLFSKDELVAKAGEALRDLKTGTAYAAFAGKASAVTVPRLPDISIDHDTFCALRSRLLARAPSAKPAAEAKAEVAARLAPFCQAPSPPPRDDEEDFSAPEPVPVSFADDPGQARRVIDRILDDLDSKEEAPPIPPRRGGKPRLVVENMDDDAPPKPPEPPRD
jgi:hypothetical protein